MPSNVVSSYFLPPDYQTCYLIPRILVGVLDDRLVDFRFLGADLALGLDATLALLFHTYKSRLSGSRASVSSSDATRASSFRPAVPSPQRLDTCPSPHTITPMPSPSP